ncbi:MAG: nucleotide exchange factor GrpE [Dehalococcoidia bacterium]|nr:nucleotide exchange factor GrpE [Dehalococcoidia bacterium]
MAESDERTVDRRAASRMNRDDDEAETVGASEGDAGAPQAGSERQDAASGDATLEELREKADSYYKNWQRSAADFINYKRRVEQEKAETSRFATAALIINLLPVYDDLERAVEAVDAHLAGLNWVQGVIAIQRKFWNMMEAMGVSEIPAAGEQFDPALHEAVAQQPGPEGQILHVAQKGYRIGDRVIRPSMVIVGQGEQG